MDRRTDGRPHPVMDEPDAFTPSGAPKSLDHEAAANTGTSDPGAGKGNSGSGEFLKGLSADDSLRAMGGLHEPRKSSSMIASGSAELPKVPITADPANEGG